jgi:hypothetical protein
VRRLTHALPAVDIRRLHKDGLLVPGRWTGWRWTRPFQFEVKIEAPHGGAGDLILCCQRVSQDVKWSPVQFRLQLAWTPCTYGGARPWLVCPACRGRAAILYFDAPSKLACRRCFRLRYRSQLEGAGSRAIRRADLIRKRLIWLPGIVNGSGKKPRGMHCRTFKRLNARHDALVNAALLQMKWRLQTVDQILSAAAKSIHVGLAAGTNKSQRHAK